MINYIKGKKEQAFFYLNLQLLRLTSPSSLPFLPSFLSSVHRLFEKVVAYFDAFLNLIPLSFVLGFYVSYVATRWWQQFLAIPWPDK